jgi:uncharacterized membrane protein
MPPYQLTEATKQQLKESQLVRCRNPLLADVVERNIQTIVEIRREMEQRKTLQDRVADAITAFSGSMPFVYLHVAWFAVWMAINLHWTPLRPFDPFPFGLLTMVVSLEAIFLSTFVLLSQNRMGVVADQRADLDLQINLLAEHEITRILKLVDAMAERMGVTESQDEETEELEQDVSPKVLLQEIEEREREK